MAELQFPRTGATSTNWIDKNMRNDTTTYSSSAQDTSPHSNTHNTEVVSRYQSYCAQLPPISSSIPLSGHDIPLSASSMSTMSTSASLDAQSHDPTPHWLSAAHRNVDLLHSPPYAHGQPTPSPSVSTEKSLNRKQRIPPTKDIHVEKNTQGKPRYSYATLIKYAIENSPQKKLTLSEIYKWVIEHYPYYGTAGTGWKNSIRHNLSLNKTFVRVARPINEPGKGSYWTVDHHAISNETAHQGSRPVTTRNRATRSASDAALARPYRPKTSIDTSPPAPYSGQASLVNRRLSRERPLFGDSRTAYPPTLFNAYEQYYPNAYGRTSVAHTSPTPLSHAPQPRGDDVRGQSIPFAQSGYNMTVNHGFPLENTFHPHQSDTYPSSHDPQRLGVASSTNLSTCTVAPAHYGVYESSGHAGYPMNAQVQSKPTAAEPPPTLFPYSEAPTTSSLQQPLLTPPPTSSFRHSQSTHSAKTYSPQGAYGFHGEAQGRESVERRDLATSMGGSMTYKAATHEAKSQHFDWHTNA